MRSDEVMTRVSSQSHLAVEQPEETDFLLVGRDETEFEIFGQLIGFATSQRENHSHPSRDEDGGPIYVAPGGDRCPACRWFEVRIFLVSREYQDDCTCDAPPGNDVTHAEDCGAVPARARYLVLTYGLTLVPNEINKRRASWTNSPYEIIEILTQRGAGGSFLPATSARVIAQAAVYDAGIRDAYVNRAVT
jgi:hypothetical protein